MKNREIRSLSPRDIIFHIPQIQELFTFPNSFPTPFAPAKLFFFEKRRYK